MGQLVDGVWHDTWYNTKSTGGAFVRADAAFRNWITPDGSAGPSGEAGFAAERDRYHLYVSYACPWAHRTLIYRALKGLEDVIDISVVHPDMLSDGWTLDAGYPGATGDTLYGLPFARDVYLKAKPDMTGRVTVPILWDKTRETVVSNESSEIIRMFNTAFNGLTGNTLDFAPDALLAEIDEVNARTYPGINNGVYRAGFATSQSAYDGAVAEVFDTLDWMEARLATQPFLVGDQVTEADWRVFPTLARFDLVYHGHFKCNRARLVDYDHIWAYTRRLYNTPGVAATLNFDHITRHYHYSHETINPHRIVPTGPVLDWSLPAA